VVGQSVCYRMNVVGKSLTRATTSAMTLKATIEARSMMDNATTATSDDRVEVYDGQCHDRNE
jgi:hypothetical protein